jgi:hypothetical protein
MLMNTLIICHDHFLRHHSISEGRHHLILFVTLVSDRLGRAIAEAVSRWLPTAVARVRARVWKVGFVVEIMAPRGRFSPSTSISPANLHSTNFSILTITRDKYNRLIHGRSAAWTQYGLHLPQVQ